MDYIDPNCPLGADAAAPSPVFTELTTGADGKLHFSYLSGDGSTCSTANWAARDAEVDWAYAEGAMAPEPETMVLLLAGGVVLAVVLAVERRQRARQR